VNRVGVGTLLGGLDLHILLMMYTPTASSIKAHGTGVRMKSSWYMSPLMDAMSQLFCW
jgi:hypothetical protein